jgi:hypothetical protein
MILRTDANGLRGPADWIDRETAGLVRALFMSQNWSSTADLDRLWSVNREALKAERLSSDFLAVADQVFDLYGFPALDPSTRARTISERSMAKPQTRGGARPATGGHLTTPEGSTRPCHAPETDSAPLDPNREFGFQPRKP